MPPIFQPEVAATAIAYAAEHPRRELLVGRSTVFAVWADRFAPGLLDRYLGKMGYRAQQTARPEDPDRPHNLWTTVAGDHGAHGRFDASAASSSAQLWATTHRSLIRVVGGLILAVLGARRLSGGLRRLRVAVRDHGYLLGTPIASAGRRQEPRPRCGRPMQPAASRMCQREAVRPGGGPIQRWMIWPSGRPLPGQPRWQVLPEPPDQRPDDEEAAHDRHVEAESAQQGGQARIGTRDCDRDGDDADQRQGGTGSAASRRTRDPRSTR